MSVYFLNIRTTTEHIIQFCTYHTLDYKYRSRKNGEIVRAVTALVVFWLLRRSLLFYSLYADPVGSFFDMDFNSDEAGIAKKDMKLFF